MYPKFLCCVFPCSSLLETLLSSYSLEIAMIDFVFFPFFFVSCSFERVIHSLFVTATLSSVQMCFVPLFLSTVIRCYFFGLFAYDNSMGVPYGWWLISICNVLSPENAQDDLKWKRKKLRQELLFSKLELKITLMHTL